jgi:UDP-N-acetylmuramoyl-tripeptide--D-alanyl-D-alanine ligase
MKFILKIILKYYLRFFARLSLLTNKPIVIAIAGSANKPFVKEALKKSLGRAGFEVLANAKNFNTEIGLPLAILNLPSGYNSYKNWIPAIVNAPKRIFSHKSTEILVLSYGTSDPGDMKDLLKVVKPDIAIITDLTQRYLEGFADMDQLMNEYELLIGSLPKNGVAILNIDNPRLRQLADSTNKSHIKYSIDNMSDYQASNIKKNIRGTSFEIKTLEGECINFQIKRHGKHHIYAEIIAMISKNYVIKKYKQQKRQKN